MQSALNVILRIAGYVVMVVIGIMIVAAIVMTFKRPPKPKYYVLIISILGLLTLMSVTIHRILIANPEKYRFQLENSPVTSNQFFDSAVGYLRMRNASFRSAAAVVLVLALLINVLALSVPRGRGRMLFLIFSLMLPLGVCIRWVGRERRNRASIRNMTSAAPDVRLVLLANAAAKRAGEPLGQLILRRIGQVIVVIRR